MIPFVAFLLLSGLKNQVQSQLKLSTRVISERLRTMVDAFCVSDLVKGLSLNLQAQSLAKIGSTIDAEIISKEVSSLHRIL